MANDFETPYDGNHHVSDSSGSDWRSWGERLVSYGNFAGPGNRNDPEHRAKDPAQANGPIDFKPIDGMDAAAERHDQGYGALDGHSMWSWDGIKRVAGADRGLADQTDQEMAKNGSKYSSGAQNYSKAMRGIFGGRASVVEGVNWAGEKAHEAGQGISNFANSAKDWHSVGDAGRGIANGVAGGAQWLGNTAAQGWNGAKSAANYFGGLGPLGVAGAVVGGGEALLAGGAHLAGQAGRGIANGVSSAAHAAGGALSAGAQAVGQGASAAWNGAKQVGQGVASGVSSAASAVGSGVSSAARAVGSGVSSAAHAVGSGVSSAAHSVGNAASKVWNWL